VVIIYNIYAIFTKLGDAEWTVKYIGERKAIEMRQRITAHLIKKVEQQGQNLIM